MSDRRNNAVGGVAAPRLVRNSLISVGFVCMGKSLYLIVKAGKWKYNFEMSALDLALLRAILECMDEGKHNPTPEFTVTGELGYAPVVPHKPYPPHRHAS